MTQFVSYRADIDKPDGKDLARRFGVSGVPTIVFVDSMGRELDRFNFVTPEQFLQRSAEAMKAAGE